MIVRKREEKMQGKVMCRSVLVLHLKERSAAKIYCRDTEN
jgi:hypothetical protein